MFVSEKNGFAYGFNMNQRNHALQVDSCLISVDIHTLFTQFKSFTAGFIPKWSYEMSWILI